MGFLDAFKAVFGGVEHGSQDRLGGGFEGSNRPESPTGLSLTHCEDFA
jgi:hypothetical protein